MDTKYKLELLEKILPVVVFLNRFSSKTVAAKRLAFMEAKRIELTASMVERLPYIDASGNLTQAGSTAVDAWLNN